MGKHLDKLKRLDKILKKFQDAIEELLEITKEGIKHPDKDLSVFTFAYAWLNYQFAIYLIKIFPKAVEADKIDKQFGKIMGGFDKRKEGKEDNEIFR